MIRQPGKIDFTGGPGEPIDQVSIETFIQLLYREDLLPGIVKIVEGTEAGIFFPKAMKGKSLQQIEMRPVWLGDGNITDSETRVRTSRVPSRRFSAG